MRQPGRAAASALLAVAVALHTVCDAQGGSSRLTTTQSTLRPEYKFNASHAALTSFGSRLRTVVFAGVTYEGVCSASRHGGMDWRGMLPRFVANALSPNADVLVFNALRASRERNFTGDCEICRGDVSARQAKPTVNCRSWFEAHGLNYTELLVVVGTGHAHCSDCISRVRGTRYGELKWPLKQPWVNRKHTKTIHIPISRTNDVLRNRVANFTKVIQDGALVKPVHVPDMIQWRQSCRQVERENRLAYVARYHEWKGQVEFLKWVEPSQVRDFSIHFYSSSRNQRMQEAMADVAQSRNISVIIHDTPLERGELLKELCAAKGAVHYAHTDANPRAIYESLLAGLPVFVTSESRIPRLVMRQSFVTAVRYGAKTELRDNFAAFMRGLRDEGNSESTRRQIESFVDRELVEERALGRMCQDMGICRKEYL